MSRVRSPRRTASSSDQVFDDPELDDPDDPPPDEPPEEPLDPDEPPDPDEPALGVLSEVLDELELLEELLSAESFAPDGFVEE